MCQRKADPTIRKSNVFILVIGMLHFEPLSDFVFIENKS